MKKKFLVPLIFAASLAFALSSPQAIAQGPFEEQDLYYDIDDTCDVCAGISCP